MIISYVMESRQGFRICIGETIAVGCGLMDGRRIVDGCGDRCGDGCGDWCGDGFVIGVVIGVAMDVVMEVMMGVVIRECVIWWLWE